MKKFSQLKRKDKLLMAYHDGNVDIRNMARSICFEEYVVESICKLGSKWVVTAKNKDKSEKIWLDYYKWYELGVNCVVLPYDEENKLWVQELLYVGTMMRNQAINNKVRNLFNSLELRAHADSAGYVEF
jgi:hypothetical protein